MVRHAVGGKIGYRIIYGIGIDPVHIHPFLKELQVFLLHRLLDFTGRIGRGLGPVQEVPACTGGQKDGKDKDDFFHK